MPNKKLNFQDILKAKIDYYGRTEAAYEFAAEEYARQFLLQQANVSGWQDVIDIQKLNRGDIVRNKQSLNSYMVEANYGARATAICSVDITNAQEWEVLPTIH